ncbi:hypothetical protein CAL7716_100310 (plasmid) [Calothrix sp. PCC 7716]|nr:hypothetical protein CAL7716_100310 [Calothrix sp. PCC 7716]
MSNILVVVLVVCLVFLIPVLLPPTKKKRKRYGIKRAQLRKQTKQANIQYSNNVLFTVLKIINSSYDPLPAVIEYLRKIEPFVFEEFLLTCFQRQGYKIVRGTRYTGDGGIDGKVYIDGRLYLIQAKRYSGGIKLAHLQEFGAVIKKNKCAGGYFIHTGKTGASCREFLATHPYVFLISGQTLIEFVKLSA